MRSMTYTPQESMDRSARWLVVAMLGLLGLGVVMVASASSVQEMERGQSFIMLRGHLVKVAAALTAFVLASRVRPDWLFRAAKRGTNMVCLERVSLLQAMQQKLQQACELQETDETLLARCDEWVDRIDAVGDDMRETVAHYVIPVTGR